MMTHDELLRKLRTLELSIHTATFDRFVDEQGVSQQVSTLAFELRLLIIKLENRKLAEIADKLDQLSPQLTAGITNLQETIDQLNDTKAIIDTFSNVLGLVARVVGFSAVV